MAKRSIKFNLDVSNKDILPKFNIKQFDDALITISTYLEGNVFNPTGNTCKLYVSVGNEVFLQESNISVLENAIKIDLDKNIISKDGKGLGELELSDGNGILTSATFLFNIESKIGEGSTIPGQVEGFIAKHERLIKEFKEEYNSRLEILQTELNTNTNRIDQVESKNSEQDKRLVDIEKKNKVQDIYIKGLFNENKDGRLSTEGEGNYLKLEGSKEGLATVEKVIGNTLVNLTPLKYQTSNIKLSELVTIDSSNENWNSTTCRVREIFPIQKLKQNTIYTSIINVVSLDNTTRIKSQVLYSDGTSDYNKFDATSLGINKIRFTTNVDKTVKSLSYYLERNTNDIAIAKIQNWLILEGDYTNKPIPSEYFEGMQSTFENQLVTQEMVDSGEELAENLGKYKCEVEVRGKNLCSSQNVNNFYYNSPWSNKIDVISKVIDKDSRMTELIEVKPNTSYVFDALNSNRNGVHFFKTDNEDELPYNGLSAPNKTFTTDNDCKYVRLYIGNGVDVSKIQIVEGTQTTSYEPYFSRTQTVYLNNPLLKGDEIVYKEDGLYHYHNMGEVVLDENTKVTHNGVVGDVSEYLIGEESDLFDNSAPTNLICDKFIVGQPSNNSQTIFLVGKRIRLRLFTRDYPNSVSVINYLYSNNVKVLFKLKEPYFEKISDDKLLLEIPNNATLTVESVIPCQSVKATYTGNVPSVYGLEETNANQDNLIDISLMATDEMYMMLEPILEMMPTTMSINERMVSKMVDMYVAMVIRGLKTIEDVPARYRKEVQDILNKLEK